MSTGIESRWALFDTSPSLVETKFNDMRVYSSQAYQMAMEALSRLQVIGQQLNFINSTVSIVPQQISAISLAGDPPSIDNQDFVMDLLSMPADPQTVDATPDVFPNFPNLVVGDLTAPNDTYTSSLMDAIKLKMLTDLQGGAIGIPADVEDAMFNRELERALLEQRKLKDRIAAEWSSKGWPLPNSALTAAVTEADINFTNKRLDISRDISIKSFELALSNYHFIIQNGIAFEVELMKWTHSVAELSFQVADALIKNQLSSFRERREGVRDQITGILEKVRAKIEYNKGLIDVFTSKINAYASKARAEGERINAVARKYDIKTNLYRAEVDFDIAQAGIDVKVMEARLNEAIANANIQIKDKEISQKNAEILNSLKVEAMKAVGEIAAQLVAGALASVHAQASIAASDSATYSAGSQLV